MNLRKLPSRSLAAASCLSQLHCFKYHGHVPLYRSLTARFLSTSSFPYPRAAVAVTIQSPPLVNIKAGSGQSDCYSYLLVQRKNPPNQGLWSLPGGKIELGEGVLEAARRVIWEETQLLSSDCDWYQGGAFMTTDAIFAADPDAKKDSSNNTIDNGALAFHYVIAQCFARTKEPFPATEASDDALKAKWWTLLEIEKELKPHKLVCEGVLQVIYRANDLSQKGALL